MKPNRKRNSAAGIAVAEEGSGATAEAEEETAADAIDSQKHILPESPAVPYRLRGFF
jgi:hypothetical protein